MAEAEGLRERMVTASDAVPKLCGFFPLLSAEDEMTGFRSAVVEKSAPAFVAAAQAKGKVLEGRDEITAAGRAVSAYLTAYDRYHSMAEEFCPDAQDTGWLASRLLLRAHFRSAAMASGIEWSAVSEQCRLIPSVPLEALGTLALSQVPFASVARIREVVETHGADLDVETAIALALRGEAARMASAA